MAAFCRRNSPASSDMDNLCSLGPAEEVETLSVKHEHRRTENSEIIQPKGPGPRTALHRCAMVGNSKTMAALIAGGCAVDLQDPDGNTALHEASWHGFFQCVKLLIRAGAEVHVKNKEFLLGLVPAAIIWQKFQAGNTALHLACLNGHAQTAQLLLTGGSNPDNKNKLGDTCVHVAARYNNLSLLKMLLRSQCSVSETNQAGDTALHVAAALNHKKVVQLLLAAGVEGRTQNKVGCTSKAQEAALDKLKAKRNKQTSLLRLTKAPQACYPRRHLRKHRARARAPPANVSRSVTKEALRQTEPRSAVQDLSERKDHLRLQNLCDEGGDRKVLQLYTLYRDKAGKVRQAPASSCPCEPLLKKVEDQLKATEEEVKLHILNIQKEVSRRLDRMERRTRQQLKALDLLNQERAAAETRNMTFRMEQKDAQDRAGALGTQAAARHELKSWCLSLLEDKDVHVPAQTRYHELLLEPSAAEPNPLSADSSVSLSTNNSRSRCAEQMRSRTYFEMKEDRSSDQNPTAPAECPSGLLRISAAPSWSSAALQGRLSRGDDPCNSRSISGPQQESTGSEPTLSQERNHQRAMEATRRFFDVVTSQLERWCYRRILDVERQSELRAQVDRKELLQRIAELEEQLHRLRTREIRTTDPPSDKS